MSIYDGFSFLINNSQQLGDFFTGIVNTMGDLADSVNNSDPTVRATQLAAFSNGVKNTVLNQGLNVLLNFAAQQLGLGGLKQSVKNVIQFIPNTVDSLLRRIVSAVATRITSYLPGSGTSGLYAGLVGSVKSFAYQGQNYTLWVAKPSSGPAQVKIAQGTNLVTVLAANMLDTRIRADSRAHFAYVLTMAGNVTRATTPRATATATADLMAALTTLEGDITANACVALSQGCFSAGTKLWSPIGYRAIEDFRPGEPIYARDEFDPAGPVEVKMVEATFTRNAAILHLHVNGQVVRTTGEHPFFAYDKGWTKASALQVGDRLLTADGSWQPVEDVLETGEWETVYNLRVADHHTYFVGDYGWGWALWAHNQICGHKETTAAQNANYSRPADVPSITDPANLILKAERQTRGMTAARQHDNLTLAYVQIVGESHPPFFASNSDSYTYSSWPTVGVGSGHVPAGQGVNSEARKHAEVKAMIRALQTPGVSLSGKALIIFTDHDPCRYCDRNRGIENAARIFGASSVTIWCPSGRIGTITL